MKSAKQKTQFVCQKCGSVSLKWQGQCPGCRQWNSLLEEPVPSPTPTPFRPHQAPHRSPVPLHPTKGDSDSSSPRILTGMGELNRTLGEGLVPGSYVLLGGSPGVGKSTLLLQMASGLCKQNKLKVLFVSAEESLHQTRLRARRLHIPNTDQIFLLNETSLENIFHQATKLKPHVLIIDSIQTVYLPELGATSGTVSQVRECAMQVMNFAKSTGTSVFVIGHITKEGSLAGPRVLEHLVDTVLSFEGEPHNSFRILRVLKNRFGATNEIGVFQMSSTGLTEVLNPSQLFLEERGREAKPGSVVFTTVEGLRPLLCEIQALSLPSPLPVPRRTAVGVDLGRLHIMTAVLDRYLNMNLSKADLFVNLVGGLKITEPAADVAMARALISAQTGKAVDPLSCFFGEVGLTGEIRASTFAEERIKEAAKLGFQSIHLPLGNKKHLHLPKEIIKKIRFHYLSSIQDLIP